MLFVGKFPRFLRLLHFGPHCWEVLEMTVRTPFCGTNVGDESHRTEQHFPSRNGHSEKDDGRDDLETGQTISPSLSNEQKGLKFTPQNLEIMVRSQATQS